MTAKLIVVIQRNDVSADRRVGTADIYLYVRQYQGVALLAEVVHSIANELVVLNARGSLTEPLGQPLHRQLSGRSSVQRMPFRVVA